MGRNSKPPGQAEKGYGSSENYITSDYSLHKFGNVLTGAYCYYYVPGKLKDGDSVPVIIMMLLAPEIYESHIFHLVNQGYIDIPSISAKHCDTHV